MTASPLILTPTEVSLSMLQQIYQGASFSIDTRCQTPVEKNAQLIAQAAASDKAVYGVNTGFGKLASVRINPEDTETLQRNLILSHCAGTGELLPDLMVRLMMSLKLISLSQAASGVRWELISLLHAMLEKGVIPLIPAQGSVGASGDLAPLAHMTAVMIGEGQARYDGKVLSGEQALKQAGLAPITLGAKEGLAMINGTQTSTALALGNFFRAWDLACAAIAIGALAVDAAMGSPDAFHPEIQKLRGQKGQIMVADLLRQLLEDSEIRHSHKENDSRVQDPYCLRCQPQILGACFDTLCHVGDLLQIEANAVTDNPLIVSSGDIISGGNFHAEPVGFAADYTAIALAEIGAVTQRHIAMLVDPALNYGLPAFLSPHAGLNSGFMIAEVTSAALMSENKALANPRSVDSTPTSANQEDHVSMACHAAHRLGAMNDNLEGILAIELLCTAQAIDIRAPLSTSPRLQKILQAFRKHVPPLAHDRLIAPDIEKARAFIAEGGLHIADMMPSYGQLS